MQQSSSAQRQSVIVVHPILLLTKPAFGADCLALLLNGESLQSTNYLDGFLAVQRANGEAGFVPAAVCTPLAIGTPGSPALPIQVVQPIKLYRNPMPGKQFDDPGVNTRTWMVLPSDSLYMLGKDGKFALVQRDNGQIGYVPALLCTDAVASAVGVRVRPLDLGWMLLGGAWFLPNGPVLVLLLGQLQPARLIPTPYHYVIVASGLATALWLFSARRVIAHSFACGVLLAAVVLCIVLLLV